MLEVEIMMNSVVGQDLELDQQTEKGEDGKEVKSKIGEGVEHEEEEEEEEDDDKDNNVQ